MKTAQILKRNLNGVLVRQNHKTAFFNANDLLDIYNSTSKSPKDMWGYFRSASFKDYREAVLKDILQNTAKKQYLIKGLVDGQDVQLDNLTIETKRGKNGGTWMHPLIFIDFAMWLSPEFKVSCVKWLWDRLISLRDEAGDTFKEVNEALFDQKPNLPPFGYSNEAKMINKLVFGNPEGGQRNLATEKQLELLKQLQKADIKLIQSGLDYYERYEKLKDLKQYL